MVLYYSLLRRTAYDYISRKKLRRILSATALLLLTVNYAVASSVTDNFTESLQQLIDATPQGGTLSPPAGTYTGSIQIDKAITIDGRGEVTIDAGGKGSVIYLHSDGVTIKNIRLTNSGESHNDIDSGIQVHGNFNVIKNNIIDETLFGIDLGEAKNNIISNNHISSKNSVDLGMRGDSIRLWYSFDNTITHNTIIGSRDMVVWYSSNNTISHNRSSGGRYALHFMYSQGNLIEGNEYNNNSVGIFLMYSDGATLINNKITRSLGTTGMGIGMKETSDVKIINNQILYCATGIYSDVSPYQPDTVNIMEGNTIAFNGIGILFHTPWWGNIARNNIFKDNITQISVDGNGGATKNVWEHNLWDDYQGFDNNQDGIGDQPYELYSYADRIWMDRPEAKFFIGTPLLASLDFLERLAPFSEPILLLRDEQPLLSDELIDVKIDEIIDQKQDKNEDDEEVDNGEDSAPVREWGASLKALQQSIHIETEQ